MSTSLSLKFDAPLKTYNTGEEVCGIVQIDVIFPCNITKLDINFIGWSECQFISKNNYQKHLNDTQCLISKSKLVRAEIFNYKFSYKLPENLPPTIFGQYGRTIYKVQAILKTDWGLDFCEEMIHIKTKLDLNSLMKQIPYLNFNESQSINCCFFNQGQIEANVIGPKKAFAIKQIVSILIDIDNNSKHPVYKTFLELRKRIKFVTNQNNSIKIEVVVVRCCNENIIKPKSHQIIQTSFRVPNTEPTTMQPNQIIIITYYLKFMAFIRGLHVPLTRNSDVLIGTIPLSDNRSNVNITETGDFNLCTKNIE